MKNTSSDWIVFNTHHKLVEHNSIHLSNCSFQNEIQKCWYKRQKCFIFMDLQHVLPLMHRICDVVSSDSATSFIYADDIRLAKRKQQTKTKSFSLCYDLWWHAFIVSNTESNPLKLHFPLLLLLLLLWISHLMSYLSWSRLIFYFNKFYLFY